MEEEKEREREAIAEEQEASVEDSHPLNQSNATFFTSCPLEDIRDFWILIKLSSIYHSIITIYNTFLNVLNM